MPYKILEHKADLKIKFTGARLEDLFSEAGKAVMSLINNRGSHKLVTANRKIELLAGDQVALLVDFLNELLSLSHIHKEVYPEIKIINLDDNSLQAELKGVAVEKFNQDIKAATYYEAEVKKNKRGKWEAVVVFDI